MAENARSPEMEHLVSVLEIAPLLGWSRMDSPQGDGRGEIRLTNDGYVLKIELWDYKIHRGSLHRPGFDKHRNAGVGEYTYDKVEIIWRWLDEPRRRRWMEWKEAARLAKAAGL